MLKTTLLLFMLGVCHQMQASLLCPPDVTIQCDDDIDMTTITGTPTLFNSPHYTTLRYSDLAQTNSCDIGRVIRKWYADYNDNHQQDNGEPSCTHIITIEDVVIPTIVNFPPDKIVSCKQDIDFGSVSWNGGPCDAVGTSYVDHTFDISPDACYKIRRRYTAINWCDYQPNDPNWNGEGIWTHDQYIKVIDKEEPELGQCQEMIVALDADCTASVTLSMQALDAGDCPSSMLEWYVEVDLWADGTLDYTYSPSQSGIFMLPKSVNGTEVTIALPGKIAAGNHKVKWNVKDPCGNWASCLQKIVTKDQKPPTPYCYQVLHAAFDGDNDTLFIPASHFANGGHDNCTENEDLKYSFSNDTQDDTLMVTCETSGIQFLNVYTTDKAKNQDYCNTFLLVFDNDLCGLRSAAKGIVLDMSLNPIEAANYQLIRSGSGEIMATNFKIENGVVNISHFPHYEDLEFRPIVDDMPLKYVTDIEDYVMLRDHLLGILPLKLFAKEVANLDGQTGLRPSDLRVMRNYLLGDTDTGIGQDWSFAHISPDKTQLSTEIHSLPLKNYVGDTIRFFAHPKGDISGVMHKLNERSLYKIHLSQKTIDNNRLAYYAEKDIVAKGIQIEIFNNVEEITFAEDLQDKINIRATDDRLIALFTEDVTIPQGQVIFYTNTFNTFDLKSKGVDKEGQLFELKLKEEISIDTAWDFYPNPASNLLTIVGTDANNISVYNAQGHLINGLTYREHDIDLNRLNQGIYFIKNHASTTSSVKKLIIIK